MTEIPIIIVFVSFYEKKEKKKSETCCIKRQDKVGKQRKKQCVYTPTRIMGWLLNNSTATSRNSSSTNSLGSTKRSNNGDMTTSSTITTKRNMNRSSSTKSTKILFSTIQFSILGLVVIVTILLISISITIVSKNDPTTTSGKQQQKKEGYNNKIDQLSSRNKQQSQQLSTKSKDRGQTDENVENNYDDNEYYVITDWKKHIDDTIQHSKNNGNIQSSIIKYITAYIEPWFIYNTTISGTGSRGNLKNTNDYGTPPQFIIPLPLRSHTPYDLQKIVYNNSATSCYNIPGKFPIDKGIQYDTNGNTIAWNVGDKPSSSSDPLNEAQYCPVDADPYLPWIHDVFPEVPMLDSNNNTKISTKIHIIAQNKRKCQTGSYYTDTVNRLIPQVTLLQSISVQRINESYAQQLAPSLWKKSSSSATTTRTSSSSHKSRYRLVPYEEADDDGMYTRFICQFYTTVYNNNNNHNNNNNNNQHVLLGETLSQYPFNYEMVSYRKGQKSLLTPKGKDTAFFWTSNLHFECPIPVSLQSIIGSGLSILPKSGIPTLFLDIIPIRTAVRYSELYLTEDMIGPKSSWNIPPFNPIERWGTNNVLPSIEASGRWTNIPICWTPKVPPPPPLQTQQKQQQQQQQEQEQDDTSTRSDVNIERRVDTTYDSSSNTIWKSNNNRTKKIHYLSACLWASASFKTRGIRKGGDTATANRLLEWIEFHLMVGFDHIYVYDNSGAHTNETSLQYITDQFDQSVVSRIDWPSSICNNNIPAADSTGERSTQYAAENSCRTRYQPYTEWIAVFDTDEYFVPMGNYTNLQDVLYDVSTKEDKRILSFRSTRGRLRIDHSTINDANDITNPKNNAGFEKSSNSLYLQAYNCDSTGSPKPTWGDRARKQIYQSDYVLYHFVHYSTVTKSYMYTYKNATDDGNRWISRYHEQHERVVNELTEAVMVHSKTLTSDHTKSWQEYCTYNYPKEWKTCWAARPWPINTTVAYAESVLKDKKNNNNWYDEKNGYKYNCFINPKLEYYWIPKLQEAIQKRKANINQ